MSSSKGSIEAGKKLLSRRMEEFCDTPFHVDTELELGQLGPAKFEYCEFDDPDYVRRHKLASLDPVHWELMSIVFEHYAPGWLKNKAGWFVVLHENQTMLCLRLEDEFKLISLRGNEAIDLTAYAKNQSLFIDRRLDQYWNTGDPDIIDVFRKALETSTDDMLMNCDPRFRERALLVTKFKKLLSNQEKSPPSKKLNKRSTLRNVIQFASDNK
jgi:ketosteroid isomerase-like protein